MSNYRVFPGSRGPSLAYSISCGLQEGWGDTGRLHTLEEAKIAVKAVLEKHAKEGGKDCLLLSGRFLAGPGVYAWCSDDGSVGSGEEDGFEYVGATKPLYSIWQGSQITREQIWALLIELASALGSALGQGRVYVALGDETLILQQEEVVTPTGETV